MTDDGTWGSSGLDLPAYLARVGISGPLEPTAETLRTLHRSHVLAIPFENLEVILGRPVRLDLVSLQAKLVAHRRGGYCFEHNLLFAAVLERLGFHVTGLSARVSMGSDRLRPATHMCLLIEIEAEPWLADVGFGGDGLLEPIRLVGGPSGQDGDFGLAAESADWALQALRPGGPLTLYRFTLEPRWPVDYEVLNWWTSTHPRSAFVHRLVVQRVAADVRSSLVDSALTVGTGQPSTVPAADLRTVLAEQFGVEVDDQDAQALAARSAASEQRGSY